MLTAQITNPSYSYQLGGSVSYSCTLEVKEDGVTVSSTGLSVTTNFLIEGWAVRIKDALREQADAYIAQYKYMLQLVQAVYPAAVVPQDVVDTIAAEVESTITV